jgi:nicotinate-nucleotide adenylyltransferase
MTARRLRIGVMGGTFDPIHHGHLVAASEAADAFSLDEVIFVPTGNPGNKTATSSPEHRYLMTVIATAANPRFTVSRVDIDRPGITYTIDTLTEIAKARPEADLYFISGADAIAQILAWKEVDSIWSLAHFVAVTRPGHQLQLPEVRDARITQLEVPALSISSTDVRIRAAAGKPIWYLVPDGVVQYIAKHKLYRSQVDSVRN